MGSGIARLRERSAGEGGFTWSELLLVSVFVVGLVLVAVTSANGIRRDTAKSDCQSERRTLKLAVAEYQADAGSFPTDLDQLVEARVVRREATYGWTLVAGADSEAPRLEPVDPDRC